MIHLSTLPQKFGRFRWFFACLLILAAGFVSFAVLQALRPAPEQRDPVRLIPTVATMPLEYRQAPLLIQGHGIVSPRAEISLSSQVSGEVTALHPDLVAGGALQQGEVIIQIDPRSFEASLAEAKASQEANYSALDFTSKQIERLESLQENGFTPEESVDEAISRRDQTLAAIARQKAIIEMRQLDLERTAMKAPFAGRVISENVDLGDIVAPGRELARFYASDAVEIVVSLSADDAAFVPGLWDDSPHSRRAWASVEYAGKSYQWEGQVERVEADFDRVTRTVDVVVRVQDPFTPGTLIGADSGGLDIDPPPLLVGMYATVSIEGLVLDRHFVVPVSALREGNALWIAEPEGRLSIEPVEFIRQEDDLAVLLAPQLAPGAPIIISDIALAADGMAVFAEEAQP